MTDATLMRTETATESDLGPIAALFRWIRHRYAAARAANELAALDDRMLVAVRSAKPSGRLASVRGRWQSELGAAGLRQG